MDLITVMKFVSAAVALLALTFLPTIIALCTRKVHWREAFVVNLVFAFTFAGWFAAIAWAATGDDAKIKTRFRALSTRRKVLLVVELVCVEVAVTGYAVFHHSSHATHLLH